ncbi:ABC transporter substrate-binding protein [Alkalihalobacterium alkalinitrilicum]|uniref:ABC transporter substrate-binding protein n=1 Tax=Alkalihalobacterium alkalinitrilicum TaxID=427920 RepID=UPI000995C163|nr:ABC transporter substrate-binding protein [Alkalihalobacterium alkalinitrilicum]
MKNQIGLTKFCLLIFSLIFILAACTSPSTSEPTSNDSSEKEGSPTSEALEGEKVLKVALPAPPGNLDPHFVATHSEMEIVQPIFNGLLRYQPGTASFDTIEGDLAENWEVSDDGLTWTFQLREGVQWHKGYGEFTSDDVKWSIERVMDPEVGSPQASMFKFVESVEAPDKYTVEITLKQPYPAFILSLVVDGVGGGAIMKREAVEGGGEDPEKLVGTGPFMLEAHSPGESAILIKNTEYFRGEPKLDQIELYVMRDNAAREVAMDRGDIHMTYGEPDGMWVQQRSQNEDLDILISGQSMIWTIHLNKEMAPMDNILVRKAISYAIDYDSLMHSLGTDVARPAKSILSDGVFGHIETGQYEYNPEKAKELLAEAGYPDGLTLPETLTPNLPAYIPVNSFIQEQLRQVGIEAPMQQVDLPTWMPALYGGQNPFNFQIGVQRPHGVPNLFRVWHSEGPANFTKYSGSDQLIEQAELELDEQRSLELMAQIQQEIKDDYISLPMIETVMTNAVRKEVELGYELIDTAIYMAPKYETTDLLK